MDKEVLVLYACVICVFVGYYYGRSSQKRDSEAWNLQRRLMDVEYKLNNPHPQEVTK